MRKEAGEGTGWRVGGKAFCKERSREVNVQAGRETKETSHGVAREEGLWMRNGAGGGRSQACKYQAREFPGPGVHETAELRPTQQPSSWPGPPPGLGLPKVMGTTAKQDLR